MKKIGKRILSLILSVVLCFTTFFSVVSVDAIELPPSLNPIQKQPGPKLVYTLDTDTGLLTISGSGDMHDFNELIKQPPWIKQKELIKKVIVEEGVTGIGDYAFYNCTNLTTVVLPSTVKSIRSNPLSVTGSGVGEGTGTNTFSYGAFRGCTSLTTINLPEGLEEIGIAAFRDCTSLKSVVLPDSLKKMGRGAFIGCTGLNEVTFGSGLKETGILAFYNCKSLSTINWLNPAKNYGNDENGKKIETFIEKVSEWSFYNTNFKFVKFPEKVAYIGARAFADCYFLNKVEIYNRKCEISEVLSVGNNTVGNPFDNAGVKGNHNFTVCGFKGSTAETFAQKKNYQFEPLDTCKHEHTHINVKKTVSCTEDGLQDVFCEDCNTVIDSDVVIPATGHDFEITSTRDDTAVDGHIRQYEKCKICNSEDVKLTHVEAADSGTIKKYIWVDGKYTYTNTATCTLPGMETYTCTVDGCGVVQKNPVQKAGHKVEKWTVTKEPNCVEKGSKTGHCSVCDKDVTETIEKTGHTLDTENPVKVEDKTETDGHIYSTYKCTVCGETTVETKHTAWVEGQYTTILSREPSCEIDGYKRDKCDICGETRNVTLPSKGGHTWEATQTIPPTCTSDGHTNYKCTVCGATKKDDVKQKLGHSYVLKPDLTVPATCTQAGSKTYICSRCSGQKEEPIAAKGHYPTPGTKKIYKEATCEEAGSGHATCAKCKEEYDFTIDALGHDFKNEEVPIEDKPGHVYSTPICTRCSYKENTTLVHKEWVEGYYDHRVITNGTCLTGELYIDTCKLCDKTTGNTQGRALGHKFEVVTIYEEPVGTAIGDNIKVEPFSIVYKCKYCQTFETHTGLELYNMWDIGYYNRPSENRTAVDYSSYLDVNKDGFINAKDYATIYSLSKKYSKYKAEQESKPENSTSK